MGSWTAWFQPCFSVFRASCSQGGSLKLEQVEGLLQRVNFSRSGALLWWKKPTACITVWLRQWTLTRKAQEKQALPNTVISLPRTWCWGHLLWHLQVHLAIHLANNTILEQGRCHENSFSLSPIALLNARCCQEDRDFLELEKKSGK